VPAIFTARRWFPTTGFGNIPSLVRRDVEPEKAAFMADSQVSWGLEALNGTISEAAWRAKQGKFFAAIGDARIRAVDVRDIAGRRDCRFDRRWSGRKSP